MKDILPSSFLLLPAILQIQTLISCVSKGAPSPKNAPRNNTKCDAANTTIAAATTTMVFLLGTTNASSKKEQRLDSQQPFFFFSLFSE